MRKTWRPVACALSVCLLLYASGCYSGQHYAAESGALIQPGMSMEEVQYHLGDPDLVLSGDPGTDTEWVYRYEAGATPVVWALLVVFAVVLIVVLVAASAKGGGGSFGGGWGGGSDGPPYQIRIHFDPQGRVVEISPPQPVP